MHHLTGQIMEIPVLAFWTYVEVDNDDGMNSGQAGPGASVDNPVPFLITYDEEGYPDELIPLLYAFLHYSPSGYIDGYIVQREAGGPWEVVPYGDVRFLKP